MPRAKAGAARNGLAQPFQLEGEDFYLVLPSNTGSMVALSVESSTPFVIMPEVGLEKSGPWYPIEGLALATKRAAGTIIVSGGYVFDTTGWFLFRVRPESGVATVKANVVSNPGSIAGAGVSSLHPLLVLVDEVDTVTYVGRAEPGAATSSAIWQISKIIDGAVMQVLFADGNSDFDNVWDDRASLSYS